MAASGATAATDHCNICSSSNIARLFDYSGYPVFECRDCTLRFLNPQPDNQVLAGIYSEHYFLGSEIEGMEAMVLEMKRRTAGLYCDALIKHLGGKTGKILEIGCGRGEFLLEARRRGFDAYGLEYAPDAVAHANQRLGGEYVRAGELENVEYRDGEFQCIVFFDLIEHVRDPKWFLARLNRYLQPGGTLMIVTPTLDSLSSKMLGRHWMEYKVEHLYYFDKRSLGLGLREAGFGRSHFEANHKILSFDYVERHFARFKVPVISPVLALMRRVCPNRLALRQVRTKASGMMVLAEKS